MNKELFKGNLSNLRRGFFFILTLHATCMAFLSVARVLTLVVIRRMMNDEVVNASMLLESVVRGAWLDNSFLSRVDVIPLLCILLLYHLRRLRGWVLKCLAVYYIVIHNLLIVLAFANIPYMAEFGKTLGSTWFVWLQGDRTVVSMVWGDPSMLLYIVLGLVLWFAYGYWCMRVASRFGSSMHCSDCQETGTLHSWTISLLLVLLCWLGIRGRITSSPIGSAEAFFSGDMALSQATLSQALSMTKNYKMDIAMVHGDRLSWLDKSRLDECSREFYGKNADEHPLLTEVLPNDSAPLYGRRPNVVLILMESMSIHYTNTYNPRMNVTPCLDSLTRNAMYFSNCYSTGFRTNNGITGSLFSQPAYLERHCIHHREDVKYKGLPYELHRMGYRNMFFCTHGPEFDKLGEFIPSNGFDDFYSRDDYPESEIVTCWGVSDRYLYSFALDRMRRASEGDKPFFSVLLTITHHPPYSFPEDFEGSSDSNDLRSVELADLYLKGFMDSVSREPWYDNTIFVMVGDHGRMISNGGCEVNDQVNHVPLLIFGGGLEAGENTSLVSQADIPAIVLGLLGHGYEYESLARDVLADEREYVLYSTMTHVVCRSRDRLFCYHVAEGRKKYYKTESGRAVEADADAEFERMERYCLSAFQLSDMVH